MPPRDIDVGYLPTEDEFHPPIEHEVPEKNRPVQRPPMRIVWRNVFLFAYLHIASVYALLFLLPEARIYTWLWSKFWRYTLVTFYFILFYVNDFVI